MALGHRRPLRLLTLLASALGALLLTPLSPAPASASPDGSWSARPAQYPRTVTRHDLQIPMSDGATLRANLELPADADGHAIDRRLPVLVTITAYNKDAGFASADPDSVLGPAGEPDYFVRRGYAQLTVDVRGTGTSEGSWCIMCPREAKDDGEVVAWAHRQPWSDGKVGMVGGSYLGFTQLFAAEQRQWLALTSALGALPPAYSGKDPAAALRMATGHLAGALRTTIPVGLRTLLGTSGSYDSAWMSSRSPITHVDRIRVPTFLVGGEHDLFQRGEPMLAEAIAANGVPTKFVDGPWTHVAAATGTEFEDVGYGSLEQVELRWYDHWLKGMDTHLDQIAPVSYYEQGSDRWVRQARWMPSDLHARTLRLSGTSAIGGRAAGLTAGRAAPGASTLLPIPVSGLCSPSTDQWTAGLLDKAAGSGADRLPCLGDGPLGALNDATGLVFQTAPASRVLHVQGPIDARLFTSTSTGDGLLSVALENVAPDGTIHRITAGWQTVSQRALDRHRSRYLDGRLIQPFHPFTKASKQRLRPGTIAPVDVEVLPTGFAIRPGHRLRLTVQGFDVPHLLPIVPDLLPDLGPMVLHTGAAYPSSITMPVR